MIPDEERFMDVYALDTIAGAGHEEDALFYIVLSCDLCKSVATFGCFRCEEICCTRHFCEHMASLYKEFQQCSRVS